MNKPACRKSPASFDFDHWSRLARTDPEAFERQRAALIERAIAEAPPELRDRLRRLQWKVDQIRRTAPTPMAALVRIYRLMWERVEGHGGLIQALGGTPTQPAPAGEVVPFRLRRESR
ncbi:MAG: DUF3135 domain-containing protein [Gammaproteobacteria bacterium]|nr:MAG: DUF3135 domain-containing protein [Gammaproteobacteria bacterium]